MRHLDPETGLIEEFYEDEAGLHVRKTNPDISSLFDRNKAMADIAPSMAGEAATRYVGSVDAVTAERWSRECGASIGTAEFMAYCKRQLLDSDNSKFLVRGF